DPKCAQGAVGIRVGDMTEVQSATNDSKSTSEDTTLNFPASDLTANDSAGPANESSQTLTVTSVTATANTHGTVSLSGGTVSYIPEGNYNGAALYDNHVCDNCASNGAADPKCATGTVMVTNTDV